MAEIDCNGRNYSDEAEDVEKLLAVVVKRRKTLPAKCMELNKKIAAVELIRLENSVVVPENNDKKDNFKRIVQGIKNLRHVPFSVDDVEEAGKKLQRYFAKVEEMNEYLQKRKKPKIEIDIASLDYLNKGNKINTLFPF